MNCRRIRAEMAIWVGEALDDEAEQSLRRHLGECPGCREHWRQLQISMQMLHQADPGSAEVCHESLWPRVADRIELHEPVSQRARSFWGRDRGAGWMAVLALATLGAVLWAGRARAELARIGGRTRSADELTPAERRVAELVAEGQTNREVAAALFLTERTVETHLTHVYAKLGVRSRTELARHFTAS
jgi:DNA-binding CsgD family transcriptional regulator